MTVPGWDGSNSSMQDGPTPPEKSAFRLENATTANVPVLIAVPHGGRDYPAAVRDAMRDPAFTMKRIEDRHIDLIGERVAAQTGAPLLVAQTPRAMIDLNRAESDVDWGMVAGPKPDRNRVSRHGHRAHSGLGLIPRRLQGLGDIWRKPLEAGEIEARLETVHRPYHAALGDALLSIRERWGAALLLDLHSMPPLRSSGTWTPAKFVVGDRFGASSDAALPAAAFAYFAREGVTVAHNRPYAGGYVLERHGAPARGLHAMQLEVDRSLYLDEALDEPGPGCDSLVDRLSGLVSALASAVAECAGEHGPRRDAAE